MRLSLGREFLDELTTPRAWSLDEESPFERCRVLNPKPNPTVLRHIGRNLDATFPQLANTPIVESWSGMIETPPDVVPVIDEADGLSGFHIATGFSGHGFGIGAGAGKAIAGFSRATTLAWTCANSAWVDSRTERRYGRRLPVDLLAATSQGCGAAASTNVSASARAAVESARSKVARGAWARRASSR